MRRVLGQHGIDNREETKLIQQRMRSENGLWWHRRDPLDFHGNAFPRDLRSQRLVHALVRHCLLQVRRKNLVQTGERLVTMKQYRKANLEGGHKNIIPLEKRRRNLNRTHRTQSPKRVLKQGDHSGQRSPNESSFEVVQPSTCPIFDPF